MSGFELDESPTKAGHRWFCNGCPHTFTKYEDAIAHATECARIEKSFFHMLFERRQEGDTATRRIAVYADGHIETQVNKRR